MDYRSYFQAEARSAQQKYMSADGQFQADAVPYIGADSVGYMGADSFEAAASAAPARPQHISQPIILNISNTNASATNVTIFGANYNIFGNSGVIANYNNPAGIVITPALGNVTYGQVLINTQNTPMKIGIVYIQTLGGSGIFPNPLSIIFTDSFGNSYTRPSVPKVDPYQQQTNVIEHLVDFLLDGTVSVNINVPAQSLYQFSFFPQAVLNSTRIVGGGNALGAYSRPDIARLITSRR